jgi:Ribonuclease G/E
MGADHPVHLEDRSGEDPRRDRQGRCGRFARSPKRPGTQIDIENDGSVKIASVDGASGKEAQRRIKQITADVEVGKIYEGTVARLMDFGAFVNILPGKDGLVHISQISDERVERVSDKLAEGDEGQGEGAGSRSPGPHPPEHARPRRRLTRQVARDPALARGLRLMEGASLRAPSTSSRSDYERGGSRR